MPRQARLPAGYFANPPLCGGKRRYASKPEAELVKNEQEIMSPELHLRVYKCPNGCGGWHLTRHDIIKP